MERAVVSARVFLSPLAGEGAERSSAGEGSLSASNPLAFEFAEATPHPALRATFSRKGRRKKGTAFDAFDALLDHAEHDGADEGDGEVRGDNAQCPGERHEVAPAVAPPRASALWLTESRCPKKSAFLPLGTGSALARASRHG
jgi:hypothetical protein